MPSSRGTILTTVYMWSARTMSRKVQTGVTLDRPVIEYPDQIAKEEERTRSMVINRIVKDHAKRQGTPVGSNNGEPQRDR